VTTRKIYLTHDEAAEWLGVTRLTLAKMIGDGRIASDRGRIKATTVRRFAMGTHRRIKPAPIADIVHGLNGYTKYGCRCEICRKARSDYTKARRAGTRLARNDVRHGLRSTYTDLGCRCKRCTAANTEYAAIRRHEIAKMRGNHV